MICYQHALLRIYRMIETREFRPPPPAFDALRKRVATAVEAQGRDRFIAAANISTASLQILLSGEFPWLDIRPEGDRSSRQLRAWARTLTRVAKAVGEEPIRVLKATGLPDNEIVVSAMHGEEQRLAVEDAESSGDLGQSILEQIEWRHHAWGAKRAVSVGILDYAPFVSTDTNKSFFHRFAQRLVGSIDHRWGIDPHFDAEIQPFVDDLAGPAPSCHLVMGLFDTVQRRRLGLDFLPIHGWKIRLSAVCFWPSTRSHSERPKWSDVVRPETQSRFQAVVIDGEAGHLYLAGPCRFPDEHMTSVTRVSDVGPLARKFEAIARDSGYEAAVLVADEETCRKTMLWLNAGKRPYERILGSLRGFRAIELKDAPECCPAYDLAIAFKAGDRQWRDLLHAALDIELYHNDYRATAQMYASVMIAGYNQENLLTDSPADASKANLTDTIKHFRSTWRPSFFRLSTEQSTANFWQALTTELVTELTSLATTQPNARTSKLLAETNAPIPVATYLLPTEACPYAPGDAQHSRSSSRSRRLRHKS
jgi:hypothetical protein